MQKLTVEMLGASGAYVGAPVNREIKWTSGGNQNIAQVRVKLASYETLIAQSAFEQGGLDGLVAKVVTSIVDENDLPLLQPVHVVGDPETGEGKMCGSLFLALLNAVNVANGLIPDSPTPTAPADSNGDPITPPPQELPIAEMEIKN